MRFKKIEPKTLRQEVYNQLRRRIISADIFPGEAINIRDLARGFGVSMMPVREALWQLESEQVIVIDSNKRVYVNELSAEEMEEALRIRLVLESMAAERSCERRPNSLLPKIKRLFEDMQSSVRNPKKYMRKNNDFHFMIYSFADSPLLLRIIDLLWARVGPYLSIHAGKADLSYTMQCHEEMYAAFCERDKSRLIKALRGDLEDAAAFIIPFLGGSTPMERKNLTGRIQNSVNRRQKGRRTRRQ